MWRYTENVTLKKHSLLGKWRRTQILLHKKAVLHVTNSRAFTGEKSCTNNAVNAWLCNFQYDRAGATDLLPLRAVYCPALERAESVEIASVKRRNKIVQEITRNVVNVFSFSGLGFQHLPRDLANVNAWKTMFDPYNDKTNVTHETSGAQRKTSNRRTALENEFGP